MKNASQELKTCSFCFGKGCTNCGRTGQITKADEDAAFQRLYQGLQNMYAASQQRKINKERERLQKAA